MTARRIAWVVLALGIATTGLHWYPDNFPVSELVRDFYANLGTSLVSIAVTVLLIDRANEARESQQLKKRLIWELGTSDQAVVSRALKELKDTSWIIDGSLRGADLTLANFSQLTMPDADLTKALLVNVNLHEASLAKSILTEAKLDHSVGRKVSLREAQLSNASLRKVNFPAADLERVTCDSPADFIGASLPRASLRHAQLAGCHFEQADLLDCDLTGADLAGANLLRANVSGVLLDDANLERANLAELRNWEKIRGINGARVSAVTNPPDGFLVWAKQNGAVD